MSYIYSTENRWLTERFWKYRQNAKKPDYSSGRVLLSLFLV